eukprot:TRINITY_DN27422_c0_g1_i1.p1 TRINITY_DN27422_c0_g1~~TRINITY_DN27422_c0_g1_i1.p1  ORF type:complete len:472 (-),score=151.37 TRINITY_DN27422_c0_g1_i1:182-1492(-)
MGDAAAPEAPPSPAGGRAKPENMEAWKTATTKTLTDASSLTKELLEHLKNHDKANNSISHAMSPVLLKSGNRSMQLRAGIGEKPKTTMNCGPKVRRTLDAGFGEMEGLTENLDISACTIEDLLIRSDNIQAAKCASLKLCEWRLKLRATRPEPEQFKDCLQAALEKEQKVLVDGRTELKDLGKQMRSTHGQIREVCKKIFKLKDKISREGMFYKPDAPPPPPAAAAEGGAEGGAEAPPQEAAAPPPETKEQLLKRARQINALALDLIKKMELGSASYVAKCANMEKEVNAAFNKRSQENLTVKRQLDKQINDVEEALAHAELSLSYTRKRIIADETGEKGLQKNADITSDMANKLRVKKAELEEDLRCKLIAWKIDDNCKRIPPHMTPAHPKPSTRDYGKMLLNMSLSSTSLGGSMNRSMSVPSSPAAAPASPAAS